MSPLKLKSVTQIAKRDISKYIKDRNLCPTGSKEVWNINCTYIFTKKAKKLNKKLGLSGINKDWENKN